MEGENHVNQAEIPNDPRGIRLGMSAAASWAWGTSLMLGMEIAQTRGIPAFLIWAAANSVTLGLFGLLVRRGAINRAVFGNGIVRSVALIIQMFCLVLQLNIINNTLEAFMPGTVARYAVTTMVGVAMTALVYRKGLPASVNMDMWKWGLAMLSCVAVMACGVVFGTGFVEFPKSTLADVSWGAWSAVILLCGPVGDVQHWQRAMADRSGRAYTWGSAFFAAYMLLVFGMAHFERNRLMEMFILLACLMVTISTINSIAVAMHDAIGGKRVGAAVTVSLCALWGVFMSIGIADLWSNFGIVRVTLAIVIVVSSLVVNGLLRGERDAR